MAAERSIHVGVNHEGCVAAVVAVVTEVMPDRTIFVNPMQHETFVQIEGDPSDDEDWALNVEVYRRLEERGQACGRTMAVLVEHPGPDEP